MGMYKSDTGLADALFSRTKQRVLGLLFGQPTRSFYAREIISLAASGSGAVQRELATLVQSGLVSVKTIGRQKHYQANASSPIAEALQEIIQKTIGLADPIRHALAPLAGNITAAFIFGSIAKRTDSVRSDIDIMLVSDQISYGDVFGALESASNVLGRPINPTILTMESLSKRVAAQESFLTRVLDQPRIWLIGSDDDLDV